MDIDVSTDFFSTWRYQVKLVSFSMSKDIIFIFKGKNVKK